MSALLEAEGLRVAFGAGAQPMIAVDGVSLSVDAGEVVGLVGESGSGKSVTALALMGLIESPGSVVADRLAFDGVDLLGLPVKKRRALLGRDIAMIFQDPIASLNPSLTIAYQLIETLRIHTPGPTSVLRAKALQLLTDVEISDPARRLDAYPHQLSGGMCQRVMVAMAIACNPRLLIADEPTTALDVTVQAQILALLTRLQRERGMAMLLITHDLGVVAQMADRAMVMYAGEIVEMGPLPDLLQAPRHPYTEALLGAIPENNAGRRRLRSLPGTVPAAFDRPEGCVFAPRCPRREARCVAERPALGGEPAREARCFYPLHGPASATLPRTTGRAGS